MHSPAELTVDVTVDAEADLPSTVTEDALISLAYHVLLGERISGDWVFGVRFVDDPTMQRAHVDFMGIDSPTDIMTFPYDDEGFGPVPEGGDVLAQQGGDLMISGDRAEDHAADAGWSTAEELFFVVVHGILHILGWNDATDDDRMRMLDRQHVLLSEWSESR
jgi:probable rRNA maturation factor